MKRRQLCNWYKPGGIHDLYKEALNSVKKYTSVTSDPPGLEKRQQLDLQQKVPKM